MRRLPLLFTILVFISIFHAWFQFGTVSGFDHPYFYVERIKEFTFFPTAWDGTQGNGFGENILKYFWVETYLRFVSHLFGNIFHLSWELVQRIGWFFPYLIAAFFIPYYFLKSLGILPKNSLFYFVGILIYSLNTYILMVIAGGQMNIALAYSFSPFVLLCFIKAIRGLYKTKKLIIKDSLITGLALAFLVILDMRYAYLIVFAAFFYFCFYTISNGGFPKKLHLSQIRFLLKAILGVFLFPVVITLILHSYWIVPLTQIHSPPVEEINTLNTATSTVSYFSFARFENSFSLLHPNWPENVFGKVYFMKPEFLIIPLLAFVSLLFLSGEKEKEKKVTILFFALLGLLGAFLAKGTNEPFGAFYLWAFEHIPGFVLFRDPTKFYTFVALSYAVLIPFSISALYSLLRTKFKKKNLKYVPNMFIGISILYLLFLIHPAVLGQLRGTLAYHQLPHEYQMLQNFLVNQSQFSRTTWFPTKQKYAFLTTQHPAVSLERYFNTYDRKKLLQKMRDPKTEKGFQEASIKYIIVPFDSDGEIFLKDNKYSEQNYRKAIADIEKINWLKRVPQFKDLGVFEVRDIKGHFWTPSQNVAVTYSANAAAEYNVKINHAKKGQVIIFNDYFDKNWNAVNEEKNQTLESVRYNKYNSFVMPADGNYSLKIYYKMQPRVDQGILLSIFFLIILVVFLFKSKNVRVKK